MMERIPVSSTLDEETARAEVYGLLAALYYAPPAPELLSQLRVAATEAPAAGAPLGLGFDAGDAIVLPR